MKPARELCRWGTGRTLYILDEPTTGLHFTDVEKLLAGLRRLTEPCTNVLVIPALVEAWKGHKEAGFKSPPGVESGTVLDPGTAEPRCWWASLKTVAANDYNLAASRYKPRVGEEVPDEDPKELIREVMALEARIQEGLEKLLREIET